MSKTNNPNGRPKTSADHKRRRFYATVTASPSEAAQMDADRGDTPRAVYLRRRALTTPSPSTPTTPDNIEDRVEAWHTGTDRRPLHAYLGWTEAQYAAWLERREFPATTSPSKPAGEE